MTIEQRLERVEQQNQKIQRTNKRLTVALTMMAVVTMAATDDTIGHYSVPLKNEKNGMFTAVTAIDIVVLNKAG